MPQAVLLMHCMAEGGDWLKMLPTYLVGSLAVVVDSIDQHCP